MSQTPTDQIAASPELARDAYEVRCDPIHRWPVLYATLRANRPFDFSKRVKSGCGKHDPFVEGREGETTSETLAIRTPGTLPDEPGWQVRIIPNKYPAIVAGSEFTFDNAHGIHEVIIECPQSETHLTHLGTEQVQLVFQSYRNRLRELAESEQIIHATIFKNHGPVAGASLPHSHSQLMGTAFVPPSIQRELSFTAEHFQKTNQDYFKEHLLAELDFGKRVVEQTDDFLVLCPSASRFSFEMQIYPRFDQSHFHLTCDASLNQLAEVMLRSLKRLEKVAADPDYNFVLHTAPFSEKQSPGFRWHWEIYPRISGIAGWELGTGSFINPLFPETAAQKLRDIDVE